MGIQANNEYMMAAHMVRCCASSCTHEALACCTPLVLLRIVCILPCADVACNCCIAGCQWFISRGRVHRSWLPRRTPGCCARATVRWTAIMSARAWWPLRWARFPSLASYLFKFKMHRLDAGVQLTPAPTQPHLPLDACRLVCLLCPLLSHSHPIACSQVLHLLPVLCFYEWQ